ncbi:MAG: PAS domain S-box protein [Verrucomicrobia bacterium]|nr:PAS domain S-box protein [Verrucomicrobiota bacterium]
MPLPFNNEPPRPSGPLPGIARPTGVLPGLTRPTGKTSVLPRPGGPPAVPALRVLHLEKSREDCEAARTVLQQAQMLADLVRVDSRGDFLTALKEFSFDFVLADPAGTDLGVQVMVEAIRQTKPQMPVILLAAGLNEEAAHEALRLGATAALAKAQILLLPETIRRVLKESKERVGTLRVDTSLNESEARFRQIADNLHQGFWMISASSGSLLMVNPALEEILGRPAGSLALKPGKLLDLVHPQDHERVAQMLELEGRVRDFQLEFRIARPDGSVRWMWNRGFPIRDASGSVSHIVGIAEDMTERRIAAEKFKRDTERLSAMLGALPDTFLLLDRAGRVADFHGGPESDLFAGQPEVKGRDLPALFPADVAAKLADGIARARERKTLVTVEFGRDTGGKERHYEARLSPLEDDHAFAFIRNITDRRRGEEELHRSQERLAHLIDSLPGIVFTTNYVGEWAVTYLSEGLMALTGYTPDELQGNQHPTLASVINPDDREVALAAMQAALAEQRHYVVEYRIRAKDGAEKWLWEQGRGLYDQEGKLVGREGFITDITARKRAENALRDSELLFHSLVENLPVGVFRKDMDGRITYVNNYLCEALRFTREAAIGKTDFDLAPPEIAAGYHASDRQVCATGEVFQAVEQQWMPDGRPCHMHVIKIPLRDASGRIVGLQGALVDVTEHREAEQKLRETNQRLTEALAKLNQSQDRMVQQERLNALGELSSGIAHDFNNSLMTILGFIELLTMKPESLANPDKVRAHLQTMHDAAREASNTVKRLSEFNRQRDDREVFPPIEVSLLIRHAISTTEAKWKDEALAAGRTIVIAQEFQEVPLIQGNVAELRDCFANVILNAVEAIPGDGTILFRTWTEKGRAMIEISDTGIGMTEEVRKRCLEPFFTTRGHKGSGLGLAIVFGILQRHQGTIDLQSTPGEGTRVTISLPGLKPDTTEGDSGLVARRATRPLKVLVVDDEPLIREILDEYLRGDVHEVVTANDGQEGLACFHAGKFDLVLTDKAMPNLSGDLMAAAIKEKSPGLPVVLITGFGDIIRASGQKPAGVDLVLSKPVSLSVLRRTMSEVVKN